MSAEDRMLERRERDRRMASFYREESSRREAEVEEAIRRRGDRIIQAFRDRFHR